MTLRMPTSFSALQRAEIAEIFRIRLSYLQVGIGFSALQRAEIAEIKRRTACAAQHAGFSALQRAEIAEIAHRCGRKRCD